METRSSKKAWDPSFGFILEHLGDLARTRTPLHIALEKNSKEIGEVLISKEADINAKDIIY